jgi:nucleoside 2-deoxyribosyltransferase
MSGWYWIFPHGNDPISKCGPVSPYHSKKQASSMSKEWRTCKMNIYFACSITGGRQFEPVYQSITRTLLESGHEVPTAHLAGADVIRLEEIVDAREVYTRDVNWIRACDALIAEVSTPSHGVGYEVAFALAIGKPVLCCFQTDQKVSKMIVGNSHKNLQVSSYTDIDQAVKCVKDFLRDLQPTL